MSIKNVHITFTALRSLSTSIIQMLSEETGVPVDKISLTSAVNNDLGIDGDDWDSILERLVNDFQCELHGLNFYDYFLDEGQIGNRLPALLLYFPIQCILFIFMYPINVSRAIAFWRSGLFKTPPNLTAADLVTSVIEKRWVPRQDVKYVLI